MFSWCEASFRKLPAAVMTGTWSDKYAVLQSSLDIHRLHMLLMLSMLENNQQMTFEIFYFSHKTGFNIFQCQTLFLEKKEKKRKKENNFNNWAMPRKNVSSGICRQRRPRFAQWSGHSLSANRIICYLRMYECRAKVQMIFCACAGIWICSFIVCSKALFSLDAAHIIFCRAIR